MIADNIFSMAELARVNGIKVYAENHDVIYLDYFTSMVDERNGMKAEYSKDGVHPNKAGYIVMMDLCSKAINKALK